ncbi:single-stranded-DNA-specific exonuclease RecJ [candidate division WWE3 bacterium]|nr:single-stranded-DNA-specific exonuclease RecJ [candidate division WWE3 bacterium]
MDIKSRLNIYGKAADLETAQKLLLNKRGFSNLDEAKDFLNPKHALEYLRNFPSDFKNNLKKSAKLIREAIAKDQPIIIHGDYDADGVCATSIIYNALTKDLNYQNVIYFIPNRFDHGYGLSKGSIDDSISKALAELDSASQKATQKPVLFITVDSGITSHEEVDYIKSLGHQILITDHHQKPDTLPKADQILWTEKIVGASIAWVLAYALGAKNPDYLALAALATVTDVYDIKGINRSIVKRGLSQINTAPPLGIAQLIETSGLSGKNITTYHLGWVLGPRINATGRLSEASKAVRLLTTTDSKVALATAKHLDQINRDRQEETSRMYDLVAGIKTSQTYSDQNFILAAHEDFHEGIIGLVASRLVRTYYRPSIVISKNEKHGKGSVRSIEGVNIIKLLREFEDLFVDLGGHPMAAGFTIDLQKIADLEQSLTEAFADRYSKEVFVPSISVDAEILLDLVNWDLFNFIEQLKPFGQGNRSPKFLTRDLGVANINFVGRDKNHTSLKLFDGTRSQKAIYFNSKDKFSNVSLGDKLDVVYSIKENNYRGNRSLDLFVDEIFS